jgi:hypothetical protein
MVPVLQVEMHRDGGVAPDRSLFPHITFEDATSLSYWKVPSQHATEVADIFYGPNSIGYDVIKKVYLEQGQQYTSTKGLGEGAPTTGLYTWPKPTKGWLVENHSYGRTSTKPLDTFAKLALRVERENTIVVAALPNKGQESNLDGWANMILSQASHAINVGSTQGTHYQWAQREVDIVADKQWTSWCAPVVSSAAAKIIAEFLKANKSYSWLDIKDILLSGADDMHDSYFGAGLLNIHKSLEITKKSLTTVISPPSEEDIMLKQELEKANALIESLRTDVTSLNTTVADLQNQNTVLTNELDSIKKGVGKPPGLIDIPNSTEMRKIMTGLKEKTPLTFKVVRRGAWAGCVASYDKVNRIFYIN